MSILVGKLVALGLDDLAIKEVRILKRRLDPGDGKMKKVGTATTASQTLDELLDFGKETFTEAKLALVITTQLQILRLLASSRKHRQIESALTCVQPSHPSSPTKLLLQAIKDSSKPNKFIRQLQSLSDILFSLGPSISTSDDLTALESRLSITPEIAFQLQIQALHNRYLWWKLAGHKGDSAKELLDPFLRCLSAFARRTQCDARESYRISSEAFIQLQSFLADVGETRPCPKSILTGIYRLLGSFAHEANHIEEAIDWTRKIQRLLDQKIDSDVKRCSVDARLAGLTLRRPSRQPQDEEILLALLEGLERPFKGESSEIDDLLTEVSATRRAAITLLAKRVSVQEDELTDGMREMCETLVLLCPRLCLRYLGSPPDANSATKDIVRYEQRRQFITKPGHNAIDSVLFLVRSFLTDGNIVWDLMDSKLQDCLLLLDHLDTVANDISQDTISSPSTYYSRISNLYYSQYLNMSRDSDNSKDVQQLRVLRRSIECVRTKPQQVKKAALFSSKLERMAEMCKRAGRYDELFKTLLTIRDETIAKGALAAVTASAATMPLRSAWTQDEEALTFARTNRSLIQVQVKHLGSAQQNPLLDGDWLDNERATMLEQYLDILSSHFNNTGAALAFRTKVFQSLLSTYTRNEYPLRRLRVLVRLLALDDESRRDAVGDIATELDALRIKDMNVEKSKDAGLRNYLVCLRTLATSILELQKDQPNIDTLKSSLVVWSSLRGACGDLRALEGQVDDVPGLLAHLQSIADYMEVKGFESIRLATLRLIADYNELRNDSSDDLVLSFTRLGSQWLHLGYSGKAGLALDRAQAYSHQNGVKSTTLLQLHLSYSEYLLAIGNCDKSEEHLLRAQAIHATDRDSEFRLPSTLEQKTLQNRLISKAYLIYSMLALERGAPQTALIHAKQSVRLLRRAWANMEGQQTHQSSRAGSPSPQTEMDKLAEETSNLSMSTIKISTLANQQLLSGPAFWPLVTPLFRAITHVSNLHAHHGMFQETLYYAEQAHKLVKETGSETHMAMASAYLGSIWLKAGSLDQGSEFLMAAKQLVTGDKNRSTALLAYHLGNMHGLLGDRDAEVDAYEEAERTLQILTGPDFINRIDRLVDLADDLEEKMASLTVSKTKQATIRKVGARSKSAAKKKSATRAKSPVEISPSVANECPQLISLKGLVLRQKARAFTFMKKVADALALLNETDGYSNTPTDTIQQGLAMAKQLLLQSIEQMHADPVYSVLQESTISFPSIMGLLKHERNSGDRLSIGKLSPPRKVLATKGRRDLNRSKSPAPDSFFDKLRQAQEHLTEVHSVALTIAPVSVIHTISGLLNNVAILLSAAGQIKGKPLAHPGFASCSIGMFKTLKDPVEKLTLLRNCQIHCPSQRTQSYSGSIYQGRHLLAVFNRDGTKEI
jgi:separase